MKLKAYAADLLDNFFFNLIWSKLGKIGPGTIKEARQLHRGVYLGAVKVWTPLGLYREIEKSGRFTFEEWEDREFQYRVGLMVTVYFMKVVAIALALQIGLDPLVVCGQAVNIG